MLQYFNFSLYKLIFCCVNYSRGEIDQGWKLYEEIHYRNFIPKNSRFSLNSGASIEMTFYIFISRNGKVECLLSNMGSFCKINSWQGLLLTTHFIIRSPQMTSFTSEKVMKSKSIKSKLAVLWSHLFPNIKDFIVTLVTTLFGKVSMYNCIFVKVKDSYVY